MRAIRLAVHTLLRRVHAEEILWLTALALVLATPRFARADAKVTLCESDSQSGSGTNLRDALSTIDPSNQINTITFRCPGASTIQITSPLVINQVTVIDGEHNITLDGGGKHNMFVAGENPGVSLFLNNLTLRNAKSTACTMVGCVGGVVAGAMSLQINYSTIENSPFAIYIRSGTLGVDHTQFVGSSILTTGIQTTITHSGFQTPGMVPILAGGTVNISDSTFVNSDASFFTNCKQLTISRGTFENNRIRGALRIGCDSSTISNSIFSNNNAAGDDGGAVLFTSGVSNVVLRSVKFLSNSASRSGGAIAFARPFNSTMNIAINYGIFKDNTAMTGGALAAIPTVGSPKGSHGGTSLDAQVVSFSHNTASSDGGAIYGLFTTVHVIRGIFADNAASGSGGAISLLGSQAQSGFANTLFVRNRALVTGSAFYGDDAKFIYSTVDSNSGLAISIISPLGQKTRPIILTNSIMSNNSKGSCGPAASVGLFTDSHNNLQFPGTDCGASITLANPRLDTMYIPLPKSAPMGNGDYTVCMSQPINGRDVYGLGRPSGGACTIGASEGDIEVLLKRHSRKGRLDQCDCGMGLLKELQRLLKLDR